MIENSYWEDELYELMEEAEELEQLQFLPRRKKFRRKFGRLYIAS